MFPNGIPNISPDQALWFLLLLIWTLTWKGLALWKSARLGSKWWFIAFLIINTLGILEILYIYVFSERGKKKAPQASTA